MILSGNSIKRLALEGMITPFIPEKKHQNGMSYGLSVASYDFRLGHAKNDKYDFDFNLENNDFVLLHTLEKFKLPKNVAGQIMDKSSWARKGLSLFNTWIDPGFEGHITIEAATHDGDIKLCPGDPLGQIIFFWVDEETQGYEGKYQFQRPEPVFSVYERGCWGERINRSDYDYATSSSIRRQEYAGDHHHERD